MRFLFYFLGILSLSECARILGIFPLNGQSHYRAGLAMMKILSARGHHVTMISPFELKNPPPNWRDVTLKPEDGEKMDFFNFNLHPYLQAYIFNTMGPVFMNSTLSHPVFKEFVKTKEKFDLIILEQFYNDGFKYMATYFDAPLILYSAQDANSWTNPTVGNPAPPSYVADLVLPYSNEMNFFQRMDNAFLYLITETVRYFIVLPAQDKIIKEHFPGAPDISEYYNNVSLVLLNGDLSVNEAVPKLWNLNALLLDDNKLLHLDAVKNYSGKFPEVVLLIKNLEWLHIFIQAESEKNVPSMVDIGGFHLSPAKPLPDDLQKILDQAKNGVIYFSMGSNIRSADMPKEKLDIFISIFSSLKQTILWKWEDENLPGKPDNVIIRKWLPQNDILAHKNVKLFITHGGIFSVMEAVNNGVPLLAFPIFGDQMLNAKRATAFGFARWLRFKDITAEILKSELKEILTEPKYSKNALKRSQIMRDKPSSAQDRLVFWVEYVMRHKGADHLKVAALKLNLFQYLLLDVISVVLVLLISLIVFVKFSVCYLLKLRGKRNSKTKSD